MLDTAPSDTDTPLIVL